MKIKINHHNLMLRPDKNEIARLASSRTGKRTGTKSPPLREVSRSGGGCDFEVPSRIIPPDDYSKGVPLEHPSPL